MSRTRQKARVLEFQLAQPSDKSANRTFIALLGRRLRPRDSGRLQRLSLTATGLPKRVLEAANILAIRTAFDLALAWPWQIDRLAATGCSRPRLAAALLAALDGTLVPRRALPVRDEEAEILAIVHSFRDSAGNRPRRRSSATAAPSSPGSTRKPRRGSDGPKAYQLQIVLMGIRPRIWRRVQVPSSISLRQLHEVIQAAMGWFNMHLHQFAARGKVYGDTDPQLDPPADLVDDRSIALDTVLSRAGSRVRYEYDFGDGWTHHVIVEDIRPAGASFRQALCLDGARACPPEDCGGPIAYQEDLLPALADPGHPRHRELRDWIGRPFDPEDFDLAAANRRCRRVKVTASRVRAR